MINSSDWEHLRDVRLEALADAPYAFTSTLERELAFTEDTWRARCENGASFIAIEDGAGIGLIGCMKFDETTADEYKIVSMWTRKDFRGSGISEKLVNITKQWAREQGADRLYLHVTSDKIAALRFYEKVEFVVPDQRRISYDPAINACEELICLL